MKPPRKRHLGPEEKQALLERVADWLGRESAGVMAAYVFGSFVKAGGFADLDLALLMERPPADVLDFEFSVEDRLERLLRLPVDVRVMNGAPLSFQFRVIREGRLILDRHPDRREDHQVLVMKEYFDFAYFRRRYLREAMRAQL